MAATVTTAGPYYSSGEIKFSSLRSNFRAQLRKETSSGSETFNTDTAAIKASELLRNTTTTETNPIVPDCTENRTSGPSNTGITDSQSNWKVSHFRNSIKYYYIAQSGTDTNFDIDAQTWNTNLNKNIVKFMFIDGTCGSNSADLPAAEFANTAYNLTVDVYGRILGAGGKGGGTSGAPAISGQNGGNALAMSSSGGNNIVVLVRNNSKIYGGGGGGEKGLKGADGSSGNCYDSFTNYGGCNCPGCPGGWTDGGCGQNYGNHCSRRQVCNRWGNCWWESNGDTRYNFCYKNYSVNGGTGGTGGNGGPGRGYNNQTGSLDGAAGGSGGSKQVCYNGGNYSSTPSDGKTGETGGSGGDWANDGVGTNNSGSGGSTGKAITGSNYSVTGTINSSTVKGAYNP